MPHVFARIPRCPPTQPADDPQATPVRPSHPQMLPRGTTKNTPTHRGILPQCEIRGAQENFVCPFNFVVGFACSA